MARNGSGTMSVVNSFSANTTISSSAVNANFTDIASEITNSLPRDGQAAMSAALKAFSGTVSAPGLSFSSDTDCGLYRIGADNIGFAIAGTKVLDIGAATLGITGTLSVSGALTASAALTVGTTLGVTGVASFADGTVSAPGIAFSGDPNTGIYRIGADNIGITAGGTKVIDATASAVTINDNILTIADNADTTKKLQFQVSGVTTGTTRTLTVPDVSDTIVTLGASQTLTSKTLTSPTLTTPVLGTPSSGTLTNCTGLPISTGVSGLAANVATFLATPSSANLAAALTDETGSGAAVFATSPTLVTPTLGVASATSVNKVAITAPATSATLTIADGKTLTASNTLTFTGTDSSTVAFGTGGTVSYATAAVQAGMEAEASTTTFVTPAIVLHNPGVAKAQLVFTPAEATTISRNITSIAETSGPGASAGDYTVTLATAFSSANYYAHGTVQVSSSVTRVGTVRARTTTTTRIFQVNGGDGLSEASTTDYMWSWWGDQ